MKHFSKHGKHSSKISNWLKKKLNKTNHSWQCERLYKKRKCFFVHTHTPTNVNNQIAPKKTNPQSLQKFFSNLHNIYRYMYINTVHHYISLHHVQPNIFPLPNGQVHLYYIYPPPPMTLQGTVKAALKVIRSACRSGSRCKSSSRRRACVRMSREGSAGKKVRISRL